MPGGGALQIYGTERMRVLGAELRAIGGPTARGLRSTTRKAIVVSTKPVQAKIQAGYRAIPAGTGDTGLREALAKGTKTKVLMSARTGLVRIYVDPKTPHGTGTLGNLPAYMEGTARKPWKHPVYPRGDRTRSEWNWSKTAQEPHPTFYPIARPAAVGVQAASLLAVRETLAQLPKVID